jgi:hypothetical protein
MLQSRYSAAQLSLVVHVWLQELPAGQASNSVCTVGHAGFKTESTVLVAGGTGRVFARGLDTQDLQVQAGG